VRIKTYYLLTYLLTVTDTVRLVRRATTKQSSLDLVTTWLLKQNIEVLSAPFITSLSNLDSKLPPNASYSFRVNASAAASLIDHFLVSKSLCDSVNMMEIVDGGINLSDHCAVVMDLLLPLMQSGVNKVYNKPRKSRECHNSYRSDKTDLSKYYAASFEYLNSIQVPVRLLCVDH